LRNCGIAPGIRAEQIGLAEFARLFAGLEQIQETAGLGSVDGLAHL